MVDAPWLSPGDYSGAFFIFGHRAEKLKIQELFSPCSLLPAPCLFHGRNDIR
jgi:hypothetical protein